MASASLAQKEELQVSPCPTICQRSQSWVWDDLGIAGSHHAICEIGVGFDDLAHLLDTPRLVEQDRPHHLFPASFIRDLRR